MTAEILNNAIRFNERINAYYERKHSITLVRINASIDNSCQISLLNESRLEYLYRLLSECDSGSYLYHLLLARVFELSLFLAGHYADHGEITAAGDLVVNPRKVNVYIHGAPGPIRKKRHETISQMLKSRVSLDQGESIFEFIRNKTMTHVMEEPIIKELFDRMEASCWFTDHYIQVSVKRIENITHTMGYLFSCHLKPGETVLHYMERQDPSDRMDLEMNLCRFNLDYFYSMKKEISFYITRVMHQSLVSSMLDIRDDFRISC